MSTLTAAAADLRHIDTWIFDLDNTLYPIESEFMLLIERRMTDFVMRLTSLPYDEARALQKSYWNNHGTTLAGLMANHNVDPKAFLDEVHEVSMERLEPDAELRAALQRLPGRRLVYTNGGSKHAARVLEHLGLADLFEDVFHLEAADFIPKPNLSAYEAMARAHGVTPASAAFFEDSEKNLKPAAELGMTTVLVGPKAESSTADFVEYRIHRLTPFLNAARLKTPTEGSA
jgi:putative hydrolase of the HAD superfamily